MEALIYMGIGLILGAVIILIIDHRDKKIYGVIDIDHNTELCKFHISSDELGNRRNTKAIFIINHEASISREEQSL